MEEDEQEEEDKGDDPTASEGGALPHPPPYPPRPPLLLTRRLLASLSPGEASSEETEDEEEQPAPKRTRGAAAASNHHATTVSLAFKRAGKPGKGGLGRVKKGSLKQVRLVDVGELHLAKDWQNSGYIFPKNFKSETPFRSSVLLDSVCIHVCEIVGEGGESAAGARLFLPRICAFLLVLRGSPPPAGG